MRVKLNIAVEINEQEWIEYCMNERTATSREVRDDVRSHFLNMIQCSSALEAASGTAEIAR